MKLPKTHYDHVRSDNPGIFEFIEKDLSNLRANPSLRMEDILPPNREDGAENRYAAAWSEHARRFPMLHPELRGGRSAVEQTLNQLIREYRVLLGFEHCERKTYFVTEGLSEALGYTQLNVASEEIRLPVECFALVFDNDFAREAISSIPKTPATKDSTITVYVRDDNLDAVGFRRLLIVAFETNRLGKQLMVVGRQLALKPGWSLEQALHTDWDKIDLPPQPGYVIGGASMSLAKGASGEEEYDISGVDMASFFGSGLMFIRLIVNSILYIASRDAELVERADGDVNTLPGGEATHLNKTRKRNFIEAGGSVEGMPIVIDPASQKGLGKNGKRGRGLKVRFLVPGFYRRPPNSTSDAKRSVWVRPHHRGPEMANVVHNPYIVK